MSRVLRRSGTVLLWTVVALCLTATILPGFLDRIYYRGPASDHFDGRRFFNPDGEGPELPGGANPGAMLARRMNGGDAPGAWPAVVDVVPGRPPARASEGAMLVTWIGHATMLVQADGLNILTDPIWSDTAGPFGIGPRRSAAPGVRIRDLPRIDLILVSHNHYDHMDLATLGRLWRRDRPIIVTSLGNDSVIAQAGVPAVALDWGQRLRVGRGEVIVTRNHHWGSRWFADRNRALWSSFVVRLPSGNFFFAGDTGAGDLAWADAAAALGPIRLAAIPIGAFRFTRGQMASGSHIGPVDAVEVYRRLGATRAVGMHWGTFRLSSEAWDTPPRMLRLARRCAGVGDGFGTIALGRTIALPPVEPRAAPPARARDAVLACVDANGGDALR